MTVRPGIEILLRERKQILAGARVGAVVHPASILPSLQHTADALQGERSFHLVSLFGPQHGARGEKQDNMVESASYLDPDTRLPVHSLYGETRRPTEEMLSDLDILIFDLQDVGTRVYTFIHTMAYCMEACARYGKSMVVLDRPNPINGAQVEGSLLDPEFSSFVGLYRVPMRHGMTVGELALLLNSEFGIGCPLTVVPMQGWRRSQWFDHTDLPWVMPSPNLPTLDSATVYPGMVLVEGTMLSEGRGTTRPFEFVGAPYVNARSLAGRLNALQLPGVVFRPAYFEPTFQKFARVMCGGVQIYVRKRDIFEPFLTGIAVISGLRALYADLFQWRQPPYEYESQKMPIEILCGGNSIPRQIEAGTPLEDIRRSWQQDVAHFRTQRRPYLLYD
ncbi:MAG: DUF1343 domain-containing protein [Acidobacteriia bacterium]|nr:DUF1343 domain-containing protein [Terriglobia bacterium]